MTKTIIQLTEYNQNILRLAQDHDLVLLDIDDVICTTSQYLCSSQWYYRYHKSYENILTSEELTGSIYRCMDASEFVAVSEQLIKDFSALAKSKMVYGLTARRISFANKTDEHLAKVEMSFTENIPKKLTNEEQSESASLSKNGEAKTDLNSYIQNSVVYVGYKPGTARPDDKGVLLDKLIANNFFGDISSVLLIDDSLHNLQNVFNALSDEIHFTGIYYTKVNSDLLRNYTEGELLILGEAQFNHFNLHGSFLSNSATLTENS